jgi:alanine dehydrogenase
MRIGVPKEIKTHEYRVGLVPSSVRELVAAGHSVIVETAAGKGIGFEDIDYQSAGAKVVSTAEEVFAEAEMIVKVKEPQPIECERLRPNQILFTYLHLAADSLQAELLMKSGCTAIAYETVTDNRGGLPLLSPMSEVAGRMSIQAGAHCLEKAQGGRGLLLGGIPGVAPAKVVVIGGGVVGTNAIRMAVGMEAQVTVLDVSLPRLRELNMEYGAKLNTIFSTKQAIEEQVADADLVIGAILLPGAAAPKLVTRDMVKKMRRGSVIVDVAIDQGGCIETSRPTTHTEPTYVEEGVVHYCVTNMPGAAPRTSAFGLNNATLPFVLQLANKGLLKALADHHLANGVNVCNGKITHEAVAEALHQKYVPLEQVLG